MFIIILVLGLVAFINGVFNKYDLYTKIGLWSSRQGSKFLYKAGNCKFCISAYLSIIVTIIVSLFVGFQWEHLGVPFAVAGLLNSFGRQ